MNILVVGGAGYIGSHMVKILLDRDCFVTILDNLSTGYRDSVLGGEFVEGTCGNPDLLDRLFTEKKYECVMHFASCIQVGESVIDPGKYYRNNTAFTLTLLEAMALHHVPFFIFSSSAAVFGEPIYVPINETHPQSPINPYGASKLMVERILKDFDYAYGLKSISLRYFNAAGADPEGKIGERHNPETHLIPLILMVASGRRESISVFGGDYDTPDGTCIRDYIHIVDLCEAHLLALEYLRNGGSTSQINLGNGKGFSVLEVLRAVEIVTKRKIKTQIVPRRMGDPARLLADSRLAEKVLGWRPKFTDLNDIVEHAWKWEQHLVDISK